MIIKRLILKNWRNFKNVDVKFGDRVFLVGPNAAGKSNFLEVFRFLRDIARSDGGGLQKAIETAGGLKKIRCLAARKDPNVAITVYLGDEEPGSVEWRYSIVIGQDPKQKDKPHLVSEKISRHNQPRVIESREGHRVIIRGRPTSANPRNVTEKRGLSGFGQIKSNLPASKFTKVWSRP